MDRRIAMIGGAGFVAAACARSAEQGTGLPDTSKWHPGHYTFVGTARMQERYVPGVMRGVQRMYAWSDIEPREGDYDFSSIRSDIRLLSAIGKQLVIQIQYKSFRSGERRVPAYIAGSEYGGGVYQSLAGAWNPVLWNPRVGERMDMLYAEIARSFDDALHLEAVVLPETSPSAPLAMRPQLGVQPYSLSIYIDALKARMSALRRAFKKTVVIQYVNYPVELLSELTTFMREHGIGLGGPDVYPRRLSPSRPTLEVYRYYPALYGIVPLGAAVQAPNYSIAAKKRAAAAARGMASASVATTEEEERAIPIDEFIHLATQDLRLNYLFWSAFPAADFARVISTLNLRVDGNDPAGGLSTELPRMAFGKMKAKS